MQLLIPTWDTSFWCRSPHVCVCVSLWWRHNDHDNVSNHQPHECLLNRLFRIKENIRAPRHWPLCGKFTGTGEFPAQRASYAENVSIWWRHHIVLVTLVDLDTYPLLHMLCLFSVAKTLKRVLDPGEIWQVHVHFGDWVWSVVTHAYFMTFDV